MSRLIFLDTETTGLDPREGGHRIVEIGAIVMQNGILLEDHKDSGIFHHYINPERIIGEEVIRIHGITNEKVRHSPKFRDIATKFLDFIAGSTLVIHNAKFDLKFLNFQLGLLGFPEISNNVIDTLILAKEKYPGSPASLDALCRRFEISLKERNFHGALLDSKLLACVYRKMVLNQDSDLVFLTDKEREEIALRKLIKNSGDGKKAINEIEQFMKLNHKLLKPSEEEIFENEKFLKEIFGN